MPTLKEIRSQIKALDGAKKFRGHKEIRELPKALGENEVVKDVVEGQHGGVGLLVATNLRLIFVRNGFFSGREVATFPYDEISSIHCSCGLVVGTVTIFTSSGKTEIAAINRFQAKPFAEAPKSRISRAREASGVPAHATDLTTELQKLTELRERGALSDEEFKAAKATALGL